MAGGAPAPAVPRTASAEAYQSYLLGRHFARSLSADGQRRAVNALERSVELGPHNAVNWRNLADAYRLSPGRETETVDAYARAAQLVRGQLEKQPADAALRADLALCLARQGRTEEAGREMAAVEAKASSDPQTHYTLALASEAVGSRDRALASLGRALELGYSMSEVSRDVELGELQKDVRYHRLVGRFERDGSTGR